MECRVCGAEIKPDARFCSKCGSPMRSPEEMDEVLEEAVEQAEEIFNEELQALESEEAVGDSSEDSSEGSEDDQSVPESESEAASADTPPTKTAGERLADMRQKMKRGVDGAIKVSRAVGDGTSRAIKKTKEISADVTVKARQAKDAADKAVVRGREISADVSEKMGVAVEKTKEISGDVAVTARKVGKGVGRAVKKTKETMDELGQVGVIITQRALDVVRASLRAVEIVDEYLEDRHSNYEVGNFVTGVGIPPYLEIEFTKRSTDLTNEEYRLVNVLRESKIPCAMMVQVVEHLASQGHLTQLPAKSEESNGNPQIGE